MSSHSSQNYATPVVIQEDSLAGILEESPDTPADSSPGSGISLTPFSLSQPAKAKSAAVASIFRLLQRTGGAENLYSELAQQLCVVLSFPIAAVALYDRPRAEMVFVGSAGIPGAPASLRTPVNQTLSGKVALSGQILCETRASQRLNYQIELLQQLRLETFVGVPVHLGDEVVAILAVADSRSRADAEHAIPVLTTVAFALAQDIRRRKLEVTLQRSERRYRSLFENIQDGFAYCRVLFENQQARDFIYLEVNDGFERLTGLRNVVGKKLTEVVPGLRETNPEMLEIYGRVALTGQPERFEIYYKPIQAWLSISVYSPEKGYFIAVFDDITARKEAKHQSAAYNERLSDLSAQMESLRQEERSRLAREIHDGLGQILTAIKIDLHRMEHDLDLFEADPRVNRILDRLVDATELANSSLQTVQELATTLRPGLLDKMGFALALQFETARFEKRTGIACSLHLPPEERRLAPAMITAMFRIVQEALTNVARHAKATQVEVLLQSEPDGCRLTIRDNGRGLVKANPDWPNSLGLLGMRERAHLLGGRVDFSTPPGGGTNIIVWIPLPPAGKNRG